MKKNFLFLTLLLGSLHALEDEIVVHLPTEHALAPIYLSKIQTTNAHVSDQYIQHLEAILYYDFEHNGRTKRLKNETNLEDVLTSGEKQVAFNPFYWKKHGAAYVIKTFVTQNKLSLFAFSTNGGTLKQFKNFTLSGVLAKDRKLIHQVTDAVHENFFDTEGIASARLLYAIQFPKKGAGDLDWTSEIWESDYDGANKRIITDEKSYSITPIFCPPCKGGSVKDFLYVSYKHGLPKIFISALDHQNGREFIRLRGNQLLPAFSSEGNKVAFISDASGQADLFVQNYSPTKGLIGKPIQAYSFPRSVQASPSFSPDGSKIAFVSDKEGTPRIYLMDSPSGTGENFRPVVTCITKKHRENTCPSWSPDGKKLAYSAKTSGTRQIFIFDFDTQKEIQLTAGPGHKENPCWARNSLHLIFNSVDRSSSELYIVNLHQREPIQLTDGPGRKHYPTWEP